jgi:hypothetical protein
MPAILSKNYIRLHKATFAIVLFLILFSILHWIKPTILYNDDGSFRPFGLGYRSKTVIPIWIAAICLAIFSYLGVLYYLAYV